MPNQYVTNHIILMLVCIIALTGYIFFNSSRTAYASETDLTEAQQQELLTIARNAVREHVLTGSVTDVSTNDPVLKEKRGIFVTINSSGQLRGCIGNIEPVEPLYLAARNRAIDSAAKDTRFSPIRKDELDNINISLSVLSVPKKAKSPDEIVLGKHGVIVRHGFRGGVFLPQVATETGWSKEEFLGQLCYQKAQLPYDAWKRDDVSLYIFTAQVFGKE